MFLGHVCSQLDLLHGYEVEGDSCYPITLSLHYAILQVFMWDYSFFTLVKCRSLKFLKDKFQRSSDMIKGLCGSSIDSHPIIFRWANLKGGNLNLVELFDQAEHLSWHSPQEFSPRFACDSVLASFLNSLGNTFDLHHGDAVWPTWLVLVPHGFQYPPQVVPSTPTTQHTRYFSTLALIRTSHQCLRI